MLEQYIFISLSEFLETISSINPIVNTLFPLTGTLVSVSSVILSSTESLIVSIAPLFGQYYALAAKALNVAEKAQLGLTAESSNNTSKFDAAKINQKGLFASQELKVTNTLN